MRAGRALRDKWAAEARREARARDPRLAAQDAAERAAMEFRDRVLARYGNLLRAAYERGELTIEDLFERGFTAGERTARTLSAKQRRIFGDR